MTAYPFHLLFWLFMPLGLLAQSLEFSRHLVDFGSVEEWNNPPAEFSFVNASVAGQYFLAPKHSAKVLLQLPRSRIESGESGLVRVFVYPGKTGPFEETVEFYTSGSAQPIRLVVRGKVKSLAANAALECPKFGESATAPPSDRALVGRVLSRATGRPIGSARVDFPKHTGLFTNAKGQFGLRLPFGLYTVAVEANGHRPYYGLSRISFSTDTLTYWLEPIGSDSLARPDSTTVQQPTEPPVAEPNTDPGDFDRGSFKPNNVVLLVDVSGSMRQDDRIGQVKEAMKGLIDLFRDIDAISLMTFNTQSKVWFELVPGNQKNRMLSRVDSLVPAGQTNGLTALNTAYELANKGFILGGQNRVILITDGQFALNQELKTRLSQESKKGIELLLIGFGGEKDRGLESLRRLSEAVSGRFLRFEPGASQRKTLTEFIKASSRR